MLLLRGLPAAKSHTHLSSPGSLPCTVGFHCFLPISQQYSQLTVIQLAHPRFLLPVPWFFLQEGLLESAIMKGTDKLSRLGDYFQDAYSKATIQAWMQ